MQDMEILLDSLPVAVIAHDLKRRIFFFNREAERLTGYRKAEVIGRDCHDVFPNGFCGDKCSFREKTELMITDIMEYHIKFIDKIGRARFFETRVVPIIHRNKVEGICAVFEDITSEISFEKELNQVTRFHDIIGGTEKMLKLYRQIKNVSRISVPVLILGESGSGKELVAQTIHKLSNRSNGPFVAVNCGALPDSLIESELFGYVKGAFTGATKTKKGRFELAHGGTLFLDEIGDISPLMQVKLLRAIQTYTIERLGDDKQIRVDIRIISATNKDLKEEIKKGNFREDLFYRLSVIPIEVPPLRERREDIPLLVKHFIDNFSSEFNISKPSISREAMEILKSYNWPGNVRELQNVIQYALVESQSSGKPIIEPCNLPSYLLEHCVSHEMMVPLKANLGVKKKKDIDLQTINEAIKKAKGNKSKAAKLLGISRATLYRILSRYEKNNMPIIK